MAKRLFDLIVAGLLLLLLAPLMLALAAWVRADSPGPALYRQRRVGQGGREFLMHKFRSMRADATGLPLTVAGDARITRAGAVLRRTRLDELPQLLDVLAGHMSLVGPRPEVPRYVAHYPAALRDRALALRPGLASPAALAWIDEDQRLAAAADPEHEYIQHILPAKLQAALDYAERATLASDIAVLWRTVRTLLARG